MSNLSGRTAAAARKAREASPAPIVANGTAPKRSICPWCEREYDDAPGTPIMCVKCGEWMVTESVSE